MKKIGAITLAALLTGSLIGDYPAAAKEDTVQVVKEEQEDSTNYVKYAGVIREIEREGNGIRATVENDEGMIMVFRVHDESLIFNSGSAKQLSQTDLVEGNAVEGYYDKHKPMLMIYPAVVTPEILIVQDAKVFGEVKIGKFDKEGLSLDGKLKVNIGEKTELVNQKGEAIEEEDLYAKGMEWVVFYDATTRSLPPQTTPKKIMTLVYVTDEMANVNEVIVGDHYWKNGVKMIPLRKVAEQLGYQVQSQPKVKGALLIKEGKKITLKRNDLKYQVNGATHQFKQIPLFMDMKTYVSEDFLDVLFDN